MRLRSRALQLVALFLLLPSAFSLPPPTLQQQFNAWKTLYSVMYATAAEELHRFSIWTSNFHRVAEHNARADSGTRVLRIPSLSHQINATLLPPSPTTLLSGLSSYRMRMNAFAHLSPHEFRRTRLGLARADLPQRHRAVDASELSLPAPSSRGIDWREKGA